MSLNAFKVVSVILHSLTFIFYVQIHQRVPLYIGSVEEVEKVEKYLA